MQVTKQTVTPKKAMEWLKRNVNNRPLSTSWSQRLADEMKAGRFRLNGEAIKFNCNGDLIDGQHRLNACVIAGVPFDSYVVVGLEHDAFDTIDQGKKRTVSDILARRGEANYKSLAAVARNVWALENGFDECHKDTFGPAKLDEVLQRHPTIRETAAASVTRRAKAKNIIDPGIAGALIYLTRQSDRARSDLFWDRVYGGEGLTKRMPEYLLRQRLIENLAAVAKLPRHVVVALCIKAWNLAKAGKECGTLKWDAGREDFPTIS